MRPKKNPGSDINRNRSIYFLIGLMIVLMMTYIALEWKSYATDDQWDLQAIYEKELIEEAPVTKHEIIKPELKPVLPPAEIEIREDEEEIEESFIATTEIDPENHSLAIDSIVVMKLPEDDEIPFIAVEDAPVFPGCENAGDKKACFQKMITAHIKRNFRYPELAQELGLEGRVNTIFVIHSDGSVGDIQIRGPHEILENEAQRILSKLPAMTPGKQRGRAVRVPFSIPIYFRLQ